VIGIDPGSRLCGWGVVDLVGGRPVSVDNGVVVLNENRPLAERLGVLFDRLGDVLREHSPTCAAVEGIFQHRNARSALILGHARGVALAVLARTGLEVAEYTPQQIKKAVTGTGRADKGQVQIIVARRLELPEPPQADAADAVAVALCHAQHVAFPLPTNLPTLPSTRARGRAKRPGRPGRARHEADRRPPPESPPKRIEETMIGRLSGTLVQKQVEAVVIDVGGVGYEVLCPLTVLERLPPEGATCVLSIHTHVREDQISLFGFSTPDERALFRQLIAVTGIGPKLAVACLSGLKAEAFARAVVDNDLKKLSGIPGVGKRTAERLVLELKDKLARTTLGGAAVPAPAHGAPGRPAERPVQPRLSRQGRGDDSSPSSLRRAPRPLRGAAARGPQAPQRLRRPVSARSAP
jgi:Holliday junction DNA helicase RuvA subunit/crossover junction endodeoxyribonuclease RuvC